MSVFDGIVTGRPKEVWSNILRKLSAYTRQDRARRFKIGITNNPKQRYRQAYAHIYDEMILLYRTSSIDYVSQLEGIIVDHNWEVADNMIAGGGGNIGAPPYYLYIVIKH